MGMQLFGFRPEELTLGNVLAVQADRYRDKPFIHFVDDGRCLTYAEVQAASNCVANGLIARGVGKGSHVATMMDNSPEHVLSYFALAKIGAVAVPINTSARGSQLEYLLDHADVQAILVDHELAERVIDTASRLPKLQLLIVLSSGAIGSAVARPPGRIALDSFEALMSSSDDPPQVRAGFRDLAMLMYTSGTTGPSKAIMHSQACVVMFGMTTAESHGYHTSDITYVCLPLNHIAGLQTMTYGSLIAGGSVALSRRFSVMRYWDDIRRSGATRTSLMGSMANMIWKQRSTELDRDHRLRIAQMTPVPAFALAFEKRFGVRVTASYGLTDYAMAAAFTPYDPVSKLGSQGRARPGIQIKIVDENDFAMATNTVGEIVLRSDNLWGTASGYYKMPDRTVEAWRNFWFHTGDRGYLDADGYLYFSDRGSKDSLRRRGENISAFEVESVILQHPGVLDVAVFAFPSEMSEDEVAAAIVRREDSNISEADIVDHCVRNMAHYMVPRYIQFLPDFPRTPSQKVEKYKLRQSAEQHPSSLWDRVNHGIEVRR